MASDDAMSRHRIGASSPWRVTPCLGEKSGFRLPAARCGGSAPGAAHAAKPPASPCAARPARRLAGRHRQREDGVRREVQEVLDQRGLWRRGGIRHANTVIPCLRSAARVGRSVGGGFTCRRAGRRRPSSSRRGRKPPTAQIRRTSRSRYAACLRGSSASHLRQDGPSSHPRTPDRSSPSS